MHVAVGFAHAARARSPDYLRRMWLDDVLYSGVFAEKVSSQMGCLIDKTQMNATQHSAWPHVFANLDSFDTLHTVRERMSTVG